MKWNRGLFALHLILDLYKEDRICFIEAIKLLRGVFHIGLYDAKRLMDMTREHLQKEN